MENYKRKRFNIFKSKKISKVFGTLIIVFILAGVSFLVYPSITNYFSNIQQSRILEEWNNSEDSINNQIVDLIQKSYDDIKKSSERASETFTESEAINTGKSGIDYESSSEELDYSALTVEDFFPAKITIPGIELEWIVNEGTDTQTLRRGPGHIIETVLPGDIGRCAISGHRTTYGAPFNKIDELHDGDLIYIEAADGMEFIYVVTSMIVVNPQDVYILDGAEKKELVLTACEPKYSAAKRLVVIAELLNVYIF